MNWAEKAHTIMFLCAVLLSSGCAAGTYRGYQLYQGPELAKDKIATVYLTQGIAVVIVIPPNSPKHIIDKVDLFNLVQIAGKRGVSSVVVRAVIIDEKPNPCPSCTAFEVLPGSHTILVNVNVLVNAERYAPEHLSFDAAAGHTYWVMVRAFLPLRIDEIRAITGVTSEPEKRNIEKDLVRRSRMGVVILNTNSIVQDYRTKIEEYSKAYFKTETSPSEVAGSPTPTPAEPQQQMLAQLPPVGGVELFARLFNHLNDNGSKRFAQIFNEGTQDDMRKLAAFFQLATEDEVKQFAEFLNSSAESDVKDFLARLRGAAGVRALGPPFGRKP